MQSLHGSRLLLLLVLPLAALSDTSNKSSCSTELETMGPRNPVVVIVGAGISGIAAAEKLHKCGFQNIKILEATGRTGGRIRTENFAKGLVEIGAQWIHGPSSGNPIFQLASQNDLLSPDALLEENQKYVFDYPSISPDIYRSSGGKLSSEVLKNIAEKYYIWLEKARNFTNGDCDPDDSVGNFIRQKTVQSSQEWDKELVNLNMAFLRGMLNWECCVSGTHSMDYVALCPFGEYTMLPGLDCTFPKSHSELEQQTAACSAPTVPDHVTAEETPILQQPRTPCQGSTSLDSNTRRALRVTWTVDTRIKMKDAGMYRRHTLSDPSLKGFEGYLQGVLGISRVRNEIEDVSRFLYFVNPHSVNLGFVKDIDKMHAFVAKLRELNLSHQTISNYLKHIRRYLTYHMNATNLASSDPELFRACQFHMFISADIQKRLKRDISREIVGKRFNSLRSKSLTPDDCQRLLKEAKQEFLFCLRAAKDDEADTEMQLEIMYYLQSLLVLKHLQRPGVIRNFMVTEWEERIHHMHEGERFCVVGVKAHKTASHQVAAFVLNQTEESWFQVFYKKVRPLLEAPGKPNKKTFFLSSTGRMIYNVSNDVCRYHRKYGVPDISSQLVRRVCETWTVSHCTDAEKGLFARYLAHSNMTAERNYREKTLNDLCLAHKLVTRRPDDSIEDAQLEPGIAVISGNN